MRATNKKNLFIGLTATLACGSLALGLALAKPATLTPAYAETTTLAFSSTGTQLDAQNAQIRFNATLTADEYAKYFDENGVAKEGTQTGMLILPLDVYEKIDGVTGLNLETYEAHDDVVQNVDTTNLWEVNENGAYEAWAKLDGKIIGEGNYNRALLYVCYVTDGTEVGTQYTDEQKTSMSYEALLAQSFDIDETIKTALADTYMLDYEVTFNDAYARTTTVEYGTKFSDMTSRDVSQLYWDANFTNQVAESDYITCDSTVYIKEENQNSDELLSFDYAVDTKVAYISDSYEPTISWLSEFEGEKGVMKVEQAKATTWAPQFTITKPKQSVAEGSAIYENYDYVVVKMYIANGEVDGVTYDGAWDYVTAETTSGKKHTLTAASYNRWITVKIELSNVLSLNKQDTQLKILGADADATAETKALWYIADVSLYKVADNVLEFTGTNYSSYVASKANGSTGTLSWNYAADAVQIDYTAGTYVGAKLTNLTTLWTDTTGYDYFTAEIYYPAAGVDPYDSTTTIETAASGSQVIYNASSRGAVRTLVKYDTTNGTAFNVPASKNVLGKWIKLIIPIEDLTDSIQIYEQSTKKCQRVYVRNLELMKSDLTVTTDAETTFTVGTTYKLGTEILVSGVSENQTVNIGASRYTSRNWASNDTSITPSNTGKWYVFAWTTDGTKVGYTTINAVAAS